MDSLQSTPNTLGMFSAENLLEAFLAGTNDGFLILDQDIRIVHFNSFYNHFHRLRHGIDLQPGWLLSDLSREGSLTDFIEHFHAALRGEVVKSTIKHTAVGGNTLWFELKFQPLKNPYNEITCVGVGVFEATEKYAAEEKLRQSEELFKAVIQHSNDALLLTDANCRIKYVSENIRQVFGYEGKNFANKIAFDVVHPDDEKRVRDWFDLVVSLPEKLLFIEFRVKKADGQWVWVENYARNCLENKSLNAIVMNVRNIQAKKMADYALVQSEQRLSLLLNNTEESFIILNSRLRIVAYNRAAQEHSPYFFCKELQSGLSILECVEDEEMENMIALFEAVFQGQQIERETTSVDEQRETHIYRHTYRPLIDKYNDIFGVFITSANITKHKLAEQKLKESEIRFKTIIQESFDAVLITDENTKIIYTSPSISNVLGYPAEQLIGQRGFDFIHAGFLKASENKFQEVLENPNIERNIDVKMRHQNGSYTWIEVKAKNMFENEYVKGVLISLRNISDRKKAEEIISLSEQRFKGLVQSGADMISILDVNCVIQYSSPTVKSIIGIDPESHKGQSILENVHPEDYEYVKDQFDGLFITLRSQINFGPYRYRNDDGKYFWLESTLTNLLGDPSIKGIVLNSRDVTEREKLTNELAANAERLKTAQSIARLGYFEYDFQAKTYFLSEQFYEIFDLKDEDLDQWSFKDVEKIIHPEDRSRVREELNKSILEAVDFNTELRLLMKNGQQKVVTAIGVAIKDPTKRLKKLSVTLQDITDSRQAMMALQTLEGRFKSLFENSIDGVIITTADGKTISANPAACKMLGYTRDEMLLLTRKDYLDFDSPKVKKLLETREKMETFLDELGLRHKAGHFVQTETASITMKDAEGNIYYSNIIRDITEKKKIEEEQRSLTQELLKNNQDLQQFSFITSHNLRAPVANLISLLSLYDKENPADDFNKLLIEKFEEATQQLNSTLNDLINVLVIKSNNNVEKEAVYFSEIFENVKRNIGNLLEQNNGRLEADFAAIDKIEYNKIHLESIFLNLISNAIRYRSPERSPLIRIKSYREDKWVIISFADNGLGIDLKRYGDRLFGLYQRFHQSKEGKGLGLYMVNSQVKAMGGKIEVESEPGNGTIFKIYFKA